jgi:hypothetical protein
MSRSASHAPGGQLRMCVHGLLADDLRGRRG